MDKLIVTDVDGVLFDWGTQFHNWMRSHGHEKAHEGPSYWQETYYPHLSQDEARRMVYHFNTSAWMLDLPTLPGVREGMARLVDNDYRFVAVTAMGLDPYAREARRINLERSFGYGVFDDVIVTDMYDPNSKRTTLETYRHEGRVWVEDKPENAVLGVEMGYDAYLINHAYNEYFDAQDYGITRVDSWLDICDHLLDTD